MDDFDKYLHSQLTNPAFKAEWDRLEIERKSAPNFLRIYPRVRLRKFKFVNSTCTIRKVAAI